MLVLSRKLGEQILVPHCNLTVTVLAVKGNVVRLGISAPIEIAVYRGEIRQPCSGDRPAAAADACSRDRVQYYLGKE